MVNMPTNRMTEFVCKAAPIVRVAVEPVNPMEHAQLVRGLQVSYSHVQLIIHVFFTLSSCNRDILCRSCLLNIDAELLGRSTITAFEPSRSLRGNQNRHVQLIIHVFSPYHCAIETFCVGVVC